MRKFTLLILLCFVASIAISQTTFNWVEQEISPGNNLQKLHKFSGDTIIICGNSNAFARFDPTTQEWNPINLVRPTYDFVSLSIKNGSGLLSSRRAKMLDFPSGGNADIYANGMLLKTTDNGESWSHFDVSALANMAYDTINPIAEGSLAMDIFTSEYIDENNIIIYSGWYDYRSGSKVSRGAIFATTDGGTSWTNLTGDLGSAGITSIYNNGTYNIFGGLNQIMKHTTGETSITDLYTPFTDVAGDDSFYINDITIIDENTFYVITTSDGIFLTTDAGVSFTKLEGTPSGGNDFYYHNANVMMILGTSSKSKATIDGGTTWVDCYPGTSCWEIAGVFNDSLYALAKSSVYKMAVTDLEAGTYTWVSKEISPDNNLHKMHIADNNTAFICGYGETMKRTTDAGVNWSTIAAPEPLLPIADEIDFNTFSAIDDFSIVAARRFKLIDYPSSSEFTDMTVDGLVFTSNDKWESWEVYDITDFGEVESKDASLNPNHDDCYGIDPYTLTLTNDTTAYVWANWYEMISETEKVTHSRVFKTTNGGVTWTSITNDFGSSFVTDINFIDEDKGYIAGNTLLLKTTDAGASFTDLYPTLVVDPQDDSTYFLKGVHAIDIDEIYITSTSNGIFKSTDGGTSFTKFDGVSGANDFFKIDDYAYMVLGTSTKSKYTKDGGTTWEDCYPGSSIWEIAGLVNDSIWALAKGSVFKIAYDELIYNVGIGEYVREINELTVKYAHERIELTSDNLEIQECILYNITGEVVAKYTPNSQSCAIETNSLPSGIYVAKSLVGSKTYINKLWIVK